MNKKLIISALFTTLFALPASAGITLKAGMGIQILAHNGQETTTNTLQTDNGTHQVLVRYQVDLSRKKDNAQLESSDTWVLLFKAENQNLQLNAPRISNASQFRQFNRNGNWRLTTAENSQVEFEKAPLKKQGFQFNRSYEQELKKFNNTDHPAAFITSKEDGGLTKKTSNLSEKKSPDTSQESAEINTEQMLRYWYKSADKNTRIRFKNWLKSQH